METIRTFVIDFLNKKVIASDIEIIDAFIRKNYIRPFRFINYGIIAKKGESIRKRLWQYKKQNFLKEVKRIEHPILNTGGKLNSEEIFYKLK